VEVAGGRCCRVGWGGSWNVLLCIMGMGRRMRGEGSVFVLRIVFALFMFLPVASGVAVWIGCLRCGMPLN